MALLTVLDHPHVFRSVQKRPGTGTTVTLFRHLIETLSTEYYDKIAADVWTMSPPCQPYTRIGLKQGSQDGRAKSFLHLLEVLGEMEHKPKYILLENVKGFEESDSRDMLAEKLKECNYAFQEFLLTPLQLGIPNSRMRYYMLAKLRPLKFASSPTDTIINYIPLSDKMSEAFVDFRLTTANIEKELADKIASSIEPVSNYLVKVDNLDQFLVPDKVLSKNGHVFDIIKPNSRRSCCFTKGYYHYAQGTGSILQMNEKADTSSTFEQAIEARDSKDTKKQLSLLHSLKLRYFTPREVANLMGFPSHFEFPSTSSVKQQYRTLGNSINVRLVAELMKYLLKE
ncbi:S-adenosyl-L-methionine-dependent methyltransferase [Radiomyces spectabilis]|uniref:S-adenosyl-L-methionine-dependent methyltransferase n=1 Tax=Radiomyces spectabilis TaxID=64574 RepID=UPI002220B2A0|nr:S-adenosyl-L-methionine-dependent methyltransferase [Radiomyces spectabilis]KAI8388852.1 S-adenosyl-L-methionine-dependent methyltransferase [Radiomyces spectabilis]